MAMTSEDEIDKVDDKVNESEKRRYFLGKRAWGLKTHVTKKQFFHLVHLKLSIEANDMFANVNVTGCILTCDIHIVPLRWSMFCFSINIMYSTYLPLPR